MLDGDVIAVVGAACRLPGANSTRQFWDLLSSGRDAVTEIPDDRWSKPYYFHPRPGQPGKSYTWAAGVIDNVDRFDAAFFGISPREARQMDPQQRLILETAWEAFEDAGLRATKLAGSGTGVFVGVSGMDYATLRLGDPASGDAYLMTGTTKSIVANRVSYIFDLRGPSFAVDTACSSSLVALDLACDALRSGRAPLAVVGGVNLLLVPFSFLGFCQASMLSPTGRCHAFDARADGYVRSEGAGVVILKPLRDALADGDPIRALIRGTGVNSDGHTMGLSLPSEASQAALLASVYEKAGVAPDRLAFIEAHGTGTQAGDPIEVRALGKTLARRRAAPLPIGSVKTNLGHLETASGMAGLIKTILALEHRELPASLHFETPNPNIPFDELNLEVAAQKRSLGEAGELIAGVNSFGFGGTNAHTIVASAPETELAADAPATMPPLLLSARSAAALEQLAHDWSTRVATTSDAALAPLLRAAATRRDHHRHRLFCTASDRAALASRLDAHAAGDQSSGAISGQATQSGKITFVFSGNGAQFLGMARDALRHNRAFRDAVGAVDRAMSPSLGWSVAARLHDDNPDYVRLTDVAQPLLFAVQVGTVEALRAQGIEAQGCVGHSVGEIAAAWAAGALSLETAARIVVARSQQQHRTHGHGGMMALSLAPDMAAAEIAKFDSLELAAINSRGNVTIAGDRAALGALEALAKSRDWHHTPLDIEYPFHSAILDGIRDDLLAQLGDIPSRDCGCRFISSVSGSVMSGTMLDADYWWRNIRLPVLFHDAVATLVADGFRIFLEIGPNPILQSYLRDGLRAADADGRVLGTLTRAPADDDPFVRIAAQCYVAGYDLSGRADFAGPVDVEGLPRYPWQRERFWYQPTADAISIWAPPRDHPLLGYRRQTDPREWTQLLDLAGLPWLADHAVEGIAVLPAAATLEIALAVARSAQPNATVLSLEELEIRQAITLAPDQSRQLRVRLDGERAIAIDSRLWLAAEDHLPHAVARIAPGASAQPPRLEPAALTARIDAATVYARARALGLDYGPRFRVVTSVDVLKGEAAHAWFAPPTDVAAATGYLLSPPLLDGGLQAFLALLGANGNDRSGLSLLPWRFSGVRLFAPYGRTPRQARLSIIHRGTRSACGTIAFYDDSGDAVAEIAQCWFRRVQLLKRESDAERTFHFALAAMPRASDDVAPSTDPVELIAALNLADHRAGEGALLFEGYIAAAAHKALSSRRPVDNALALEDVVASAGNVPGGLPLLWTLLSGMARHGGATATADGKWQLAPSSGLPDPALIWRTILNDAPHLAPALALAAAAAERLPDFLTGRSARPSAPPPALVDHFLHATPSGIQVANALERAVISLAVRWPEGRPLRILEIGAASGALTRHLLGGLAGWHGTLRYVAIDPDADHVGRLSARIQGIAGASATAWDPHGGPIDLGTGFDVIVSANALTRLHADAAMIATLRQMLAPNGLIVAAEPQPNCLWDWIFGQDAAWWSTDLADNRPASPLRAIAAWRDLLVGGGFADAETADIAADPWPAGIAIARRDAVVAAVETTPAAATIIVAEHGDPVAQILAQHLVAAGGTAEIIVPPEIGDGNLFCALLSRVDTDIPEIVVLPPRPSASDDCVAATSANLLRVITVAHLVAATRERARLWLVTENAHQTADGSARHDAALWGLGRTLANELPRLDCRLVDMSSRLSAVETARHLAAELLAPDGEREIVATPNGRHVLRLRRGTSTIPPSAPGPVRLVVDTPGRLDSLRWEPLVSRAPEPGEVAIAVHTADLNFRDVMWALDLLPEEALLDGHAGPTLGLACGGTVTAVGDGVEDFKPGDRVLAIAPATLSSEVVISAHTVARLPDGLDFAAAATLPVAFVTVIYALGHLTQLKPGERVLIHGGAGGIGLAAIQYALHRGAEVIATSGSPTKRAFLRELGTHHVFDSRDLAFVDAVRKLTDGAGVDVVLNSLSGDAMEQSLALLKPFGRFLELGKRDFFTGTRISLRPLRHNISYFAIDIDTLAVERPDLATAIMRETIALIEAGALRPLPYRRFARAEVGEAFRLMQASGHIGKILVDIVEPERQTLRSPVQPPRFIVRGDGTYLVTGGLSGFGLATAEWLASQGARSLALLGRRGAATPGSAEALVRLMAAGVDVRAFACDVADPAALDATLVAVRHDMPPLKGIIHAAMAVDDALLSDLNGVRLERVMAPKLGGADNLDRATRKDPIELFVLYSSATASFGAPGQGSYVAANAALESVARRRRSQGLPAMVVGWGPIADAGYLARHAETRDALARRLAANPMPAREALDALPSLWNSGETVVDYASVRWDAARNLLPGLTSPTFADIVGVGGGDAGRDVAERLAAASPDERKDIILAVLVEEVARILSSSATGLDPHRSVAELGMDSLMAVELRLALERRLGINLPMLSLSQQTSLAMIAANLARGLAGGAAARHDLVAAAQHYETADPGDLRRAMAPREASNETAAAR